MSEQGESRISRNRFLKLIGLASVVAGGAVAVTRQKQEPQQPELIIRKKTPTPTQTETPKNPEQLLLEQLQAIVDADIFSDQRTRLEKQFAESAHTVEEIDKGFWVIQNEQAREMLRDKKWNLRQTGDPEQTGLKKLPDQLQKWAESKAIHPETLAWCYEANDEINSTLAAMNIQNTNDNLSVRLNTGGMAMLLTLENRGFINVGRVRATEQMPENQRGTLFELCSKLEPVMGLKLYAPNIAGSQETSPGAQNGGAVGGQFRADTSLYLMKKFESIGKKFNPFDIRSSIVGGSVLIGSDEGMNHLGFRRNDSARKVSGLTNWFGDHPAAIQNVLGVDQDYQQTIVKTNIAAY